jgi:hypothetical protein
MSGHQRPRHWRASEADAQRHHVAPGTVLARPTRAERRAEVYVLRHASAKTPEDRLIATVDYFRSVVSTARKRDRSPKVPDVPGLDERIDRVDALVAGIADEIEHAGRIPNAPGRRDQP